MTVELPDTNLSAFLLFSLGRKKRLKVVGRSMLPLLKPGEEILIDSYIYRKSSPQINDLVVTIHPYQPNITIVKRIVRLVRMNGNYKIVTNLTLLLLKGLFQSRRMVNIFYWEIIKEKASIVAIGDLSREVRYLQK